MRKNWNWHFSLGKFQRFDASSPSRTWSVSWFLLTFKGVFLFSPHTTNSSEIVITLLPLKLSEVDFYSSRCYCMSLSLANYMRCIVLQLPLRWFWHAIPTQTPSNINGNRLQPSAVFFRYSTHSVERWYVLHLVSRCPLKQVAEHEAIFRALLRRSIETPQFEQMQHRIFLSSFDSLQKVGLVRTMPLNQRSRNKR